MALTASPPNTDPKRHFFCIDNELVYWNFYLDFGPLNLGQLYRFCQMLNKKLNDERHKGKVIYYFSSTHAHKRTNAAFLISAWAMLYLGRTPEEAFAPFRGFSAPFPPWVSICALLLSTVGWLQLRLTHFSFPTISLFNCINMQFFSSTMRLHQFAHSI